MTVIRRAISSDARSIAEIQVAGWQAAYRGIVPDALLDGLEVRSRVPLWERFSTDGKGDLLVADAEDGVAGFCHLIPSRDPGATGAAEIAAMYVRPKVWRSGLGRKLCAEAVLSASERGYERMTLWVLAENHRGRRFYEAMGFDYDATLKHEVINGVRLEEARYLMMLSAPSMAKMRG